MRSLRYSVVAIAIAASSTAVRGNVIALNAVQAAAPQSTFTLSFSGQPLPSSYISNTTFSLQLDDQPRAGAAQFLSYNQNVAPLTLPDGQGGYVSTGDITVEIEPGTSGGGSYDVSSGLFTTTEIYKISYTGDLTSIGLGNGGFVEFPSTSSGTISFDPILPGVGTIHQQWSGTYSPLGLDYSCEVFTTFPEPASLGLLGFAILAIRRKRS